MKGTFVHLVQDEHDVVGGTGVYHRLLRVDNARVRRPDLRQEFVFHRDVTLARWQVSEG